MADDLEAYLNALPAKLEAQLSDVVREQAEMLSAAQRQALQSLEQSDETGDLEASCVVVPGESDLEFIVQAGGDLTTKEVREGSGVGFDYALAFEFGTSRQAARPFFWPTYREHKDEIREAINQGISEVLDQS
jgi:HK97 gp10 family phage protein